MPPTHQPPCPLIHEAVGGAFYVVSIHNGHMKILQETFNNYYEEIKYILHS